MNKGTVFVVSGPSGSGKDTILQEVFLKRPDIFFSISCVTRKMRSNESDGEKYRFISREEFLKGLENNDFLEYNKYLENYYGTPKAPVMAQIEKGNDVIIEVDVNGKNSICNKLPEAVSVFILPPSFNELKCRLSGRGTETEEQIKNRLDAALSEIKSAVNYDYIIVNDVLSTAVEDVLSVLNSEKLKTKNQKYLINEVFDHAESGNR